MMKNSNLKSSFISYRSSDGKDLPFSLYNYLINHEVDTFFDQSARANGDPIKSVVVMEASKRHNLIVIFSERSIKELINFCHDKPLEKDYVYEEINAALRNHNNIIPVFFESMNEKDANKFAKELFENCLGLEDSYSYILRKPEESHVDLFKRILERIKDKQTISHVNLSNFYWVGTRESDIPDIGEGLGFKGAILFFGQASTDNRIVMCDEASELRVDHNDASDNEQDEFIITSIAEIIKKDPEAKFMLYNPYTVFRLELDKTYGMDRFICLNDKNILECVNSKSSFRTLFKNIVPLLPVIERTRADCDYDDLLELKERGEFEDKNDYQENVPDIQYDDDIQFIVQAPVSSGGAGTFILNRENAQYLLSSLDKRAKYLVSVYHTRNISVNIHVIIYANKIVYSPASIQIVREVSTENKLMYKGADFIAYKQIRQDLRQQFEKQVMKVAEKLQQIGYRGVCGVDAIIHDGRVNIVEVNGRFQASTELINRAMLRRGYKSIQELNYEAFFEQQSDGTISNPFDYDFKVPYSNYLFSYEGQLNHDEWVYNRALNSKWVEDIQLDGYVSGSKKRYNAQAYLYRIVFNKNIVSINEDGAVLMHENICEPDKRFVRKIISKEKLAVKIALMIQGISIEKSISNSLREATNNAVDLQIGEDEGFMIINSPTNIKFVEFSPFTLVNDYADTSRYMILYYGEKLVNNVRIFPADKNQNLQLSDGRHYYSEIAYLSTDRLRIHLTNECCFKLQNSENSFSGRGCQFCNIEVNHNPYPITESDIDEVVKTYINDKRELEENNQTSESGITLKHFLIGGQSLYNGDKALINAAKVLSKYWMPIYVMTLPLEQKTVQKLVEFGVLEYAYNIEIFNEECRKKYMPGKGQISTEKYMNALRETRKILDRSNYPSVRKAVRSMIVVGLEPYKDMLDGIRTLIEYNIEPMLSVFRPLPNTPLEDLNAPPIELVYKLFHTVNDMLYEVSTANLTRFRRLGPKCTCCQNNTVSLPWNIQKYNIIQTNWCIDKSQESFKE